MNLMNESRFVLHRELEFWNRLTSAFCYFFFLKSSERLPTQRYPYTPFRI